jgi:hypothetical protein
LRLLKPGGILGLITPSIWTRAKYGSKLREFVSKNFKILAFIDFGDLKVFQDATTYPSIIILKKEAPSNTSKLNFSKIKELPTNGFSLQNPDKKLVDTFKIPQTKFGSDPWVFKTGTVVDIVDKMEKISTTHLKDIRDQIYEGFITGNNEVFFLGKKEIEDFKLEKEYVKPVPKGKKVRRFFIDSGDLFVVYPYDKTSEGTVPFSKDEAPNVWHYLELHNKELKSREYLFKNSSKKWFDYVRPRDKSWFERPKILTPNLSAENNFAVDYRQFGNYLYVDHDCYGITLKSNDINELFFITALLNSKLIELFIKQRSPMFSGGYYKYHTQYLDPIPLVFSNKERLVELAKMLNVQYGKLAKLANKPTDEKYTLQKEIDELETKIDDIVFNMYGLTAEEQKIVLQCTKTTKNAKENN